MAYAIATIQKYNGLPATEFLGKGSFTVNHERYLVLTGNDIKQARTYKTKGSAKRAYKKILASERYVNASSEYEIIEI